MEMNKFTCDICGDTFPADAKTMVETAVEYVGQDAVSQQEIQSVINGDDNLSKFSEGAMCICLDCQSVMATCNEH